MSIDNDVLNKLILEAIVVVVVIWLLISFDDDINVKIFRLVVDDDWSITERTALWWWKDKECFLSWMSVKGKCNDE